MKVDNAGSSAWYNIAMPKSLVSIARDIESQRPVFKAIRKVMNWYVQKPFTPGKIATKIAELHERADAERMAMEESHAKELMPFLEIVRQAQKDAKALGEKHRLEKESITMGFAQVELELLQEKITEVPDEIPKLNPDTGAVLGMMIASAGWLAKKFGKRQPKKVVNSEVAPQT